MSRRARGILGTAMTWAVGLSALSCAVLIVGVEAGLLPSEIFGIKELVAIGVRNFVAGGVAGGLFAFVMSRRERGRRIAELSYRRTGTWGFVGLGAVGALLGLAAPAVIPAGVLAAGSVGLGVLGSGFAMGSLALARRAEALPVDARLEQGSTDRLPPEV